MNNLKITHWYRIGSMQLECLECRAHPNLGNVALFLRLNDFSYIVATFIDTTYSPFIEWGQGHYFTSMRDATRFYFDILGG